MKHINLNINYQNISYLYNKIDYVRVQVLKPSQTIHLLGISETHLEDKMDDAHIEIQNYILARRDPQLNLHTGLAVYIHNSISKHLKRRHDLEINGIECMWFQFNQSKSSPLLICFMYRNPDDTFRPWLDRYESMIEKAIDTSFETIIQGDYNIDLNKPQTTWNNFNLTLGFSQLIKEVTRKSSGTLLDHIYTNSKDKVTNASVIKTSMSDHYMIACSYITQTSIEKKKDHTTVQYRCYKKFNSITFLADISILPLGNVYHTTDPNIALKTLQDLLSPTINKHIPLKTRRVKHPNLPIWINENIKK